MKRLLDKFPVLLFDMGGTFVFDCDKFGSDEDFYQTYCSLGGKALSSQEVIHFIRACFDGMMRDYNNSNCYDNFPTLTEGFQRHANPPKDELPLLEKFLPSMSSELFQNEMPSFYVAWHTPTGSVSFQISGHQNNYASMNLNARALEEYLTILFFPPISDGLNRLHLFLKKHCAE